MFDIGFLEQLEILDFEGNNVKDLDQLYYLRRCPKLTHVNLKHNPVQLGQSIGATPGADIKQKQIEYYQRIQENCPRIQEHDDEVVDEKYFQTKTESASAPPPKPDLRTMHIFRKFEGLGLDPETIRLCVAPDMDAIDNEPTEDKLVVNAVKYADQDKKAMRDFEEAVQTFAGRPPSGIRRFKVKEEFRGTFATGFNVSRTNFAPPPFKEFNPN